MAKTHHAQDELAFHCTQCGECCRHLQALRAVWPEQTDGVCHYLAGNLCSIYESRPDLCDYTRAYKHIKSLMSYEEYQQAVIEHCAALQALCGGSKG